MITKSSFSALQFAIYNIITYGRMACCNYDYWLNTHLPCRISHLSIFESLVKRQHKLCVNNPRKMQSNLTFRHTKMCVLIEDTICKSLTKIQVSKHKYRSFFVCLINKNWYDIIILKCLMWLHVAEGPLTLYSLFWIFLAKRINLDFTFDALLKFHKLYRVMDQFITYGSI